MALSAARIFIAALATLCLVPSVCAQWVTPDASQDDLSQKWTVGDTMAIMWKGWDASGARPSSCDLWVTTFRNGAVEERILSNVDLSGPGNFNWKVNLTNAQVSKDPQYVLRFVSHVKSDTPTYPKDSPMFGSRGFYIYPGPNAASSATPTPSSSPTPGPTASNAANGTGSSSTAPKKKKKSNAGAIAGGVLGGLVVLALILVGVLMLLRRQRKKREAAVAYKSVSRDEERNDVKDHYAYEAPRPTVELADHRYEATELPGSEPQPGALTGQYASRKHHGPQPVEMGARSPPVGTQGS